MRRQVFQLNFPHETRNCASNYNNQNRFFVYYLFYLQKARKPQHNSKIKLTFLSNKNRIHNEILVLN